MQNKIIKILIAVLLLFSSPAFSAQNKRELLNVSYDPTYELYEQYNQYFSKYWQQKTGEEVKIYQSHGGSGKQARALIEGLEADVVTLALAYDISAIANKTNLLPKNWQRKFANNSSPYFSTIVFLVRKGNPKHIKDWDNLIKNDVQIITPNPKTSGGARWNYLGALVYANKKFNGDETKIIDFMTSLFSNVKIYDTGARGSGITFAQSNIGDVLISWENEAFLLNKKFANQFEIVTPSISILAEPPVAVVDGFAAKHNNKDLAVSYIKQLYSNAAGEIIVKNFYRSNNSQISQKYQAKFPELELITIEDLGGWDEIQKKHFDDNGIFDQITKRK
jgi:sulfate/thiosulfate transport system substrate-binding protein